MSTPRTFTRRAVLQDRYWAFRWGIHFHHPVCCVLRYSLDRHHYSAARRGGKVTKRAGIFVPCGILHHPDRGREPFDTTSCDVYTPREIPFNRRAPRRLSE